jgi:hypothetical protein
VPDGLRANAPTPPSNVYVAVTELSDVSITDTEEPAELPR